MELPKRDSSPFSKASKSAFFIFSPDVDNEIRIDAKEYYLRIGDFTDVIIEHAEDFDLYAKPIAR